MERSIMEKNTGGILNPGRQFELDIAKTFAIFFMICVHVSHHMSTMDYSTYEGTPLRVIIELLAGPTAAPLFMFAMGVGIVYSRKSDPATMAKRGVVLILTGYALNFFRETLLIIIARAIGVETGVTHGVIDSLFFVDILPFAGMAFLAIALMKKLGLETLHMLLIALILQSIGTILIYTVTSDWMPLIAKMFVGLAINTGPDVDFSLMLWLPYPVTGMWFGEKLQMTDDKDMLYKKVFAVCAVIFFGVTVAVETQGVSIYTYFTLYKNMFYHVDIIKYIWVMAFDGMFLSFCYAISEPVKKVAFKTVSFYSARLNNVYIVQWLLISYTYAVFQLTGINLPAAGVIPASIIIMILSGLIANLYIKIRDRKKNAAK